MSSQPNSLHLNREERRFLGVCAGIADYLDMPVVLVRIIFVISILTWPTLIIAYFALYFWLDRNLSSEKVVNWLSGSAPTRHLKNLDYKRPLYRNMRHRRIAGVCAGFADYLEIRTLWVRCMAILAIFLLGPYALLAYGVCWFVMEPDPAPRHREYRRHRHHGSRRRRRWRQYRTRHHAQGMSSSRYNTAEAEDDYASGYDEVGSEDPLYGDDTGYDTDQDPVITDLERKREAKKARMANNSRLSYNEKSVEECADTYYAMESRLRELEAFITSKKFRLHCEINRI